VLAELNLADHLSRQWYFWGYTGYELGVPDLLWQSFGTRHYQTVIEVGANVGYYTLLLAAGVKQFSPGGVVHVFEPYEPVFRQLKRNVALNPRLPIVLNLAATTDRDGEVTLYIPACEHARTNASLVADLFDQNGTATVKAIRLDEYCESKQLSRLHLVKMDCEGAEPAVLRGMKRLLETDEPDLVIEVLPQTEEDLEAILRQTRYRRYLITAEGPQPAKRLVAHAHYRDYFLSTTPLS
jgi:FkbM family methyltransferase